VILSIRSVKWISNRTQRFACSRIIFVIENTDFSAAFTNQFTLLFVFSELLAVAAFASRTITSLHVDDVPTLLALRAIFAVDDAPSVLSVIAPIFPALRTVDSHDKIIGI
jgi:hypothetical protein